MFTAYTVPKGSDGVFSSGPSSASVLPSVLILIPPGPKPSLVAPNCCASLPSPSSTKAEGALLPGTTRPFPSTRAPLSSPSLTVLSRAPDIWNTTSSSCLAAARTTAEARSGMMTTAAG